MSLGYNDALRVSFDAVGIPTKKGSATVTTTPAVLFTDATASVSFRRVRITNMSTSTNIAINLQTKGSTADATLTASGASTDGIIILPNQSYEELIEDVRVVAVSASGSVSVNFVVYE